MTTHVLDEFIIKLGIDPKQFDDAQKAAFDKLRKFEDKTNQASASINDAMRKGMFAFYEEFNKGLDKSGKSLNQTGDQSRRVGEKIFSAGTQSAAGFKQLTGSLLEAYAVVGLLEGAFHKLESSASRATATVITAQAMGTPPRELATWAGIYTQAPSLGAAEQMQYGLTQFWQKWKLGLFPAQETQALARIEGASGAKFNMSDLKDYRSFNLVLGRIVRGLIARGHSAMLGTFLNMAGIPLWALPELRKPESQILQDVAASRTRQPANAILTEQAKLVSEIHKTEQSWTTLWDTIEATAAKNGGVTALKKLDLVLKETTSYLGNATSAFDALQRALTLIGVALGVILTAGKGIRALGAIPAWIAAPLAGLLTFFRMGQLNKGAALEKRWLKNQPHPPNTHWDEKQGMWLPGAAPAPAPAPAPINQEGELPAGAYNAISHAEGTLKGGKIDYNAYLGYGKFGKPNKPVSTMTLQEAIIFGNQMRASELEQGFRKNLESTSSAIGAFQITGSNIAAYAAAHHLDLGKVVYTPALQRKIAAWVWGRQGSSAWEGFNTHPADRTAANNAVADLILPTITVTPKAPGLEPPVFQHGGIVSLTHPGEAVLPRHLTDFLLASARIAVPALAALSYGRRAGAGGSVSQQISIGSLNVHTRATDAHSIARELPAAIRRELTARSTALVTQANTIFE